MIEFFDLRPETNVQEAEYTRLLGYPPGHPLTERARELADWAQRWYSENGRPWLYAIQIADLDISNSQLRIDGVDFSSRRLHEQLLEARAHTAVLVAVTAGSECEEKARQLWLEEKPDEYFFLEVYGSAVVEHLITTAGARLCARGEQDGMAVLPHYSPGYPEWHISDQGKLLAVIRRKKPLDEIRVLHTGMLKPKKSLLAVFGITNQLSRVRDYAGLPCESCSMQSCQYRRAPYKFARNRIEDVRQLQSQNNRTADATARNRAALDLSADYSASSRTLRKWSQERLQLDILPDGSVEARFRYEGTTCSNLGHRLEYDYHVGLGSVEAGYEIIEMSCEPAPGDRGHRRMCEYLNDARQLEAKIANEKPLLGRPLNDILIWQRASSPSACFCEAAGREHKWGLVLEVVHYALAEHERGMTTLEREEDKILEYGP